MHTSTHPQGVVTGPMPIRYPPSVEGNLCPIYFCVLGGESFNRHWGKNAMSQAACLSHCFKSREQLSATGQVSEPRGRGTPGGPWRELLWVTLDVEGKCSWWGGEDSLPVGRALCLAWLRLPGPQGAYTTPVSVYPPAQPPLPHLFRLQGMMPLELLFPSED